MPRPRVRTMQCVSPFVHGMAGRAGSLTMLMMKTLGEMIPLAPCVVLSSLGTARGNAATPLSAVTPASTELKAVRRRITWRVPVEGAGLREKRWVFD